MTVFVSVLVSLIAALVAYREWLVRQESPQKHKEPFDGVVYRVGKAAIAERHSEHPTATVIAMHGFVEDMRYFAQHYRDPSVQLIVLTSCDYHVPIDGPVYRDVDWARVPAFPEGSIEYDAAVLVQALEHLPKTSSVRVHGHSRGGAVTLEAARLRPDLFQDVEVILEAPVLPRGRLYEERGAALMWAFAFLIPYWRKDPLSKTFARAYGKLEDPRKRELMAGMPHNPKHVRTFADNVNGITRWMRERDGALYKNVRRGVILIAEFDRVLASEAMRTSAQDAPPNLQVVEVTGSSHFILLDRPEVIPELKRAPARVQSSA